MKETPACSLRAATDASVALAGVKQVLMAPVAILWHFPWIWGLWKASYFSGHQWASLLNSQLWAGVSGMLETLEKKRPFSETYHLAQLGHL